MPVKQKMLAEAADWACEARYIVLSSVTKMSLGQSGEVDKRQSTEHTPPESLKHRINSPKLFLV
jgi:hypothetical protein